MVLSTYIVEKNQILTKYFKNSNEYLITQNEEEQTREIILGKLYLEVLNIDNEDDEDFIVKYKNSIGTYSKKNEMVKVKFINEFKRAKTYNYKIKRENRRVYFENLEVNLT